MTQGMLSGSIYDIKRWMHYVSWNWASPNVFALPFQHVLFQKIVNFQLHACEKKVEIDGPSQRTLVTDQDGRIEKLATEQYCLSDSSRSSTRQTSK